MNTGFYRQQRRSHRKVPTECPFKPGDRVRLVQNPPSFKHGRAFFRDAGPEESAAVRGVLIVSRVGEESAPGIWDIEVEGPLNRYLMSSRDVEPDFTEKVSVTVEPSGITTIVAKD
jgi:hypothetical protein